MGGCGTAGKLRREAALEAEIARLKIALADPALELDFFRGALQKTETLRRKHAPNGGEASTNRSGTPRRVLPVSETARAAVGQDRSAVSDSAHRGGASARAGGESQA